MSTNPPLRHESHGGTVSRTAQMLGLFRDDLKVRYAERTVPEYMHAVRRFLAWLEARGVALFEVRTDDVLAYQKELSAMIRPNGKLYCVATQAGRLNAVKQLFRCLYKHGVLLSDPAGGVSLPRLPRTLPRVILTQKEALKFLRSVTGDLPKALRDRALLETLYATGVRVSELAALTVSDVDTEERLLRVVKGKGSKDRNIPLTQAAADAIQDYLVRGRGKMLRQPCQEVFIGDGGSRLSRSVVNVIIRKWAKRAGIVKHVTCHTFRHSVATHLLQNRADIRHIQEFLGHSSLRSTEVYTHVAVTDLKKVVARAHPRGR
jgi:integrase/recombinase XerD